MAFITGNSSDNSLNGGSGEDTIWGLGGDDTLYGLGGNDTLLGFSGDDFLYGGSGWDTLIGGAGNDYYDVNSIADVVLEDPNGGYDTVAASVSYTLGANVETLILYNLAGLNGFGNQLDNQLIGGNYDNYLGGGGGNDLLQGKGGDDVLDGGTGNDWMVGGSGNDTFYIDSSGDHLTEDNVLGTDLVKSYITYSLANDDYVENLELLGSAAINGFGNGLSNTLWGNSGNNQLDGGAGADRLIGGGGNDTYYADNAGDVVVEGVNAGTDWVYAQANHTLGGNVENLVLLGAAVYGAGNGLSNRISGNDLNNTLNGGNGADTLIGGLGADTMTGGAGGDTYYLDDLGDVVIETDGGGGDWVLTRTDNYTLGANVENLELSEPGAPVTGIGNELDNQILGNPVGNILYGLGGDDTIDGVFGGDDTIAGSGPSDTLIGGIGGDTYYIHTVGSVVTELMGEGHDSVHVDVAGYTLADNAEDLFMQEDGGAMTAAGNGLDNLMWGNSFANDLNGLGGVDTLFGGGGDDDYIIDNANDQVIEFDNDDYDRVYASATYNLGAGVKVEYLELLGADDIAGVGNEFDNTIAGNGGGNMLSGATGDDTLIGMGGNDTFEILAGDGHDTIVDFTGAGIAVGDVVLLNNTSLTNFAEVLSALTDVAGGCQLEFDAGNSVFISNVSKAQFDASDFVFV